MICSTVGVTAFGGTQRLTGNFPDNGFTIYLIFTDSDIAAMFFRCSQADP